MICYQCGSQLGSGHLCLRCGADVSIYRKIVRASNGLYNAGREKARLRDLTGAVEALSKSLQLNKRNTNARNLLDSSLLNRACKNWRYSCTKSGRSA